MANLSITAANVKLGSTSTTTQVVVFGEGVTEGQFVYRKASDGKYWLADTNVALHSESGAYGVVLTPASADGRGLIATAGSVVMGATLVLGEYYQASSTAGALAPAADFASAGTPRYQILAGIATSTTELRVAPQYTGVAVLV
jgi:hypothetical protein